MSRGASSIGTGGGGTIYEYRVAALDLVALLCGVPVPGLDVAPDTIRLQGSEFPLDDVIALNRKGPYELAVERQVKRTLEIAPSSEPWRKTMRQCLQSLESFGDEIDADRHRLGVTASGPLHGLEVLRSLAAYAAAQKSVDDLLRQLSNLGQDHRRLWRHLVDTVRDLLVEGHAAVPTRELAEQSAFRIARRLIVQVEPTEQISPRYPYLCSLLEDRVLRADTQHDAAAVYQMVEGLAQEWGPRAGAVDAAMLRNRLKARGVVLRGDPPARDRTASSRRVNLVGDLEPADALHLEVHPAFETDISSGALSVLPPYIARPASVDDELRHQVARAAKSSRLLMVVGGSSTGKTRSCWEAVRAELPNWRIVHPLAPDRPAALMRALREDVLEPRTVLWLNEANLYLLVKNYAAQVSASLQAVLTDPQRGPVLVLGTMWPDFWEKLTEPRFEDDDLDTGMGAVHQLADLAVTVKMPATFTSKELARATAVVDSDPRLKLARSRAISGRITQFLAGAPHLWRRYEQSAGAARAILHAAMDARRCGHGPLLSEDFLRVAAEGYIDEATWHTLDEGWFASHMAKLLSPHRQLPGPLTRYRPRSDQPPPASPLYQLADFLHEKSRATRERESPASSLWAAAAAHSRTDTDMRELAQAARRLGALECEQLYLKAAACGDVAVLQWFIRRLITLRRFERAEELIENHSLDGFLLGELSAALGLAGHFQEAERLARRAYEVSGNLNGARSLAHHLLTLGMHRPAERVYSWLAETGDPVAARWLTAHREARGDRITAERLARTALTQYGDPSAALALAQLRVAAGKPADAERLCRLIAGHGHAGVLVAFARERSDHRDHATALCFYRAAAAEKHPKALEWMSWRCEGQGQHQRAEELAHAAAAAGNSHALHGLAHLRFFNGRLHDAERLNRAAAQAGSLSARAWLMRSGFPT
ncbi:tetratricopeptide repeat protein [Streptomyces acidiscabies]|uniref:tetratricopeptide repeat protein n=1 Tax=Streptomyces acidiscabies TaxID=42234 RepID=UPI000A41AEA4|nr:hypothetical protein [Streptomyces acidiscabies]